VGPRLKNGGGLYSISSGGVAVKAGRRRYGWLSPHRSRL